MLSVQDSAAPEGKSELSIEKLETQLNTLKTMFAEKQKLVSDLEAYGPTGGRAPAAAAAPAAEGEAAPAEGAEAGAAPAEGDAPPAEEAPPS